MLQIPHSPWWELTLMSFPSAFFPYPKWYLPFLPWVAKPRGLALMICRLQEKNCLTIKRDASEVNWKLFSLKNYAIKKKMNIFYSTDFKNLCSSKDSIKRLKRQATNWERYLHMYNPQKVSFQNTQSMPKNRAEKDKWPNRKLVTGHKQEFPKSMNGQ